MTRNDRATDVLEEERGTPQPPRGWVSREERRLALGGLAGFFALGLYAALFVVIGQVLWS